MTLSASHTALIEQKETTLHADCDMLVKGHLTGIQPL